MRAERKRERLGMDEVDSEARVVWESRERKE